MGLLERMRSKRKLTTDEILLPSGLSVTSNISNKIAPTFLNVTPQYIEAGSPFGTAADRYAAASLVEVEDDGKQEPGWIERLMRADVPSYERGMHLVPMAYLRAQRHLLIRLYAVAAEKDIRKGPDEGLDTSREQLEELIRQVQRGENAAYRVSSYYQLRAGTPRELLAPTGPLAKMKTLLKRYGIDTREAFGRHQQVFKSLAPHGDDVRSAHETMETRSIAKRLNFNRSGTRISSPRAVEIGEDPDTGIKILADPLHPDNETPLMFEVGGYGGGKTAFNQGLSWAFNARGPENLMPIFIDSKTSHDNEETVYMLNGNVVGDYHIVGPTPTGYMNALHAPLWDPLDRTDRNPLQQHIASFNEFYLKVLEIPDKDKTRARAVLNEVLVPLYGARGMRLDNPASLNGKVNYPILADLEDALDAYRRNERLVASRAEIAETLADASRLFTAEGSLGAIFSKPTTIRFDRPTGISLSQLNNENTRHLKPVFMQVTMDIALRSVRENRLRHGMRQVFLTVDDAFNIDPKALQSLIVSARSLGLFINIIVQDVDYLNQLGGYVNSAQFRVLFRHDEGKPLNDLVETLGLSSTMREKLIHLKRGEAFWGDRVGGEVLWTKIKMEFDEEELIRFGSSPRERTIRDARKLKNHGLYPGNRLPMAA